ncbi:MAG: hypothetical protein AABW87_00840 [Nanoarchaeota archaeon]
MKYLTRGKRGIIYLSKINGRDVAIKVRRPGSFALNTLEKEARWLRKLNKHNVGPKLISFDGEKLIMEYVKGKNFVDYFYEKNDKKIALDVLKQCYKLDKLKINKYEMHNPVKHIIVRKNKPILIDFERCRFDSKPKNVTQFCQFLVKLGVRVDINRLIEAMKEYKKSYTKKSFDDICRLILNVYK